LLIKVLRERNLGLHHGSLGVLAKFVAQGLQLLQRDLTLTRRNGEIPWQDASTRLANIVLVFMDDDVLGEEERCCKILRKRLRLMGIEGWQ
jgi:hypothetical protein